MGPREALLHLPRVLHDLLRRLHARAVPEHRRAASDRVRRVRRRGPPRRPRRRGRRAHQLGLLVVLRRERDVGRRDALAAVLGDGERDDAARGRGDHLPAPRRRRERRAGEQRRDRALGLELRRVDASHRQRGVEREAQHPDVHRVRVLRRDRVDARVHHEARARRGRREAVRPRPGRGVEGEGGSREGSGEGRRGEKAQKGQDGLDRRAEIRRAPRPRCCASR